jgi:hypothetical protein
LDQALDNLLDLSRQHLELEPIPVDPELARPKSFLKVMDAEHFNWTSDRLRKLFAMRVHLKVPPLDQMNLIYYPDAGYSAPIFIFFCLLTKRKVIGHINVNCPFDDDAYRATWLQPLVEQLKQVAPLDCADRYPEWMKKYRNECTVYGMFPRDRYEDLLTCAQGYLNHYLEQLKILQLETDPNRIMQIQSFQAGFVEDIRTQDKAQSMMAKILGKDKAKRIFHEVTT